jgi:hypothetical protein
MAVITDGLFAISINYIDSKYDDINYGFDLKIDGKDLFNSEIMSDYWLTDNKFVMDSLYESDTLIRFFKDCLDDDKDLIWGTDDQPEITLTCQNWKYYEKHFKQPEMLEKKIVVNDGEGKDFYKISHYDFFLENLELYKNRFDFTIELDGCYFKKTGKQSAPKINIKFSIDRAQLNKVISELESEYKGFKKIKGIKKK